MYNAIDSCEHRELQISILKGVLRNIKFHKKSNPEFCTLTCSDLEF